MQTNISAIIVDDSAPARKLLRLMLSEIAQDIDVLGEAGGVNDAVQLIKNLKPDVVFLDIEMPGKSGLQLVEEISREQIPFEIVFTTAYNEYAIRAFRLSAIDYLLKPIEEQQLSEAIQKIRKVKSAAQSELRLKNLWEHLNQEQELSLTIPHAHGYAFIKITDILYIRAEGSYAEVISSKQRPLTVSRNLKYFEKALEGFPQFVRVHRSFLINIQQIQRFDKAERGVIVMNDGYSIDLARERRDAFFKAIGG